MKKNLQYILGIHQSGPIASAALFLEGNLLVACPEERVTRIKQDASFPNKAIQYCLDFAQIKIEDIQNIAIGWNPGINVSLRYRGGFSNGVRYPGDWLTSVPNNLLPKYQNNVNKTTEIFEFDKGKNLNINYYDHHDCHSRLAQASSGFNDCAILVVDGYGEQKTTSWVKYEKGKFSTIKEKIFPQSLGCLYAAVTNFLGYKPFSDEWRVMGMASYGNGKNFSQIEKLITLKESGDYEIDLSYFDFYNYDRPNFFSKKMTSLLGKEREVNEEIEQRHYDIAAALQSLFEKVMDHMLGELYILTNTENICLAGGSAMNCVYNGKVTNRTKFNKCHISFAPDDSGNSIGAALMTIFESGLEPNKESITPYVGREFSDLEIEDLLKKFKLTYKKKDNISKFTASLLAQEKIVGWFQGRSEFGQRALGMRSILASPREAKMKDKINSAVKFREPYRPFAPVIPLDNLMEYFEIKESIHVPYMEKTLKFRVDKIKDVPAVVHQDMTGRVQTVTKDSNPLLLSVLNNFNELTGVPVILNTSFNINGEPVVDTIEHALRTYISSGLDALVIGSYVIEK